MEEKKKKKKLTVTVSSKKTFSAPRYTGPSHKTSVVIEKKIQGKKNEQRFHGRNRNLNIGKSSSEFKNRSKPIKNTDFVSKKPTTNRNFDIRKIAEARATKRFRSSEDEILSQKKAI